MKKYMAPAMETLNFVTAEEIAGLFSSIAGSGPENDAEFGGW